MRFFRENESMKIIPEVTAAATMGAAVNAIVFGRLDYSTLYQSLICGVLCAFLTAFMSIIFNRVADRVPCSRDSSLNFYRRMS